MLIDLTPELRRLYEAIANAPTYGGGKLSPSLMRLVSVEIRKDGGGILAPEWFAVTERGRGPRRRTQDHELWKKIYRWMDRRGMFRAKTPEGRISEAKGLTWYINKYGNKHFRSKQFIDVYTSARKVCIRDVEKKYGEYEFQITQQIL